MIVLGWVAVLIGGLALALFASTRSVRHVGTLAEGSRIPPFFIGITLLAVGTDLPEIANSVISCFAGHGDLNAGDSVGSAVTQATLVLGLLPFLGGAFAFKRLRVLVITAAGVAGLALGAWLMRDGMLSRADGASMVLAWLVGSALVWRYLSPSEPVQAVEPAGRVTHAALALLFLALVGVGAAAAVAAFVRLSTLLGVSEYVLGFFVASVGTSLPELIVDVAAMRAGLRDMALGDVLGSTFVDATLSIGIGPLLFPATVTAASAVLGSLAGMGALAAVMLIMTVAGRHNRISGTALVALYIGLYFVLLR